MRRCLTARSAWARWKRDGVFPYLIVIWFVVTSLRLAVDSLFGFSSAVVDGFHLGAKFRVKGVEVLVSS